MEVYTLDSLLRRIAVIDRFESLIWTEKWKDIGDFQLVIHSTNESRQLLTVGTRLAINDSWRVMTVENVENKVDNEGKALLTVTGRSLEALLDDRVAMDGMEGLTANDKWALTDTPGNIARTIFKKICVDGLLDPADVIPFINIGSIFPPSTIAESIVPVTVDFDIRSVYASIKEICDTYDLGFRLIRNLDTSQLYFDIYTGNDRTTQQSSLTPVVFSPELDNLTDVTELTSISKLKNVCYVFAKNGTEIVYANGVDPSEAGFTRRVMSLKVDDTDLPAGPELTKLLRQKGADALSQNQGTSALDGEVPQFGSYKYAVDYDLGDLVEMRNSDGATNSMRVTEQIFVSDGQGERSYPTLLISLSLTPGSWRAWDYNQVWQDANGTWADA